MVRFCSGVGSIVIVCVDIGVFWPRWERTVGFKKGPVDVGRDAQLGIT